VDGGVQFVTNFEVVTFLELMITVKDETKQNQKQ